jgi:predicted DsbA family dithiol-disulfide isomerase
MTGTMVLKRVDVIIDVVCPWCYIGKRRLEAALAARAEREPPRVTWMPYQLKPDVPLGGIDRRSYLERKFGGASGVQQFYDRLSQLGREVGIFFNFERISRQPNTLDAHCLIAWAQAMSPAAAASLVERLFRGFFVEGVDIGDRQELARLAASAGLDAYRAAAWLVGGNGREGVMISDERARRLGIAGVPLYIFNRRVMISGAQPTAVLLDAMTQSARVE